MKNFVYVVVSWINKQKCLKETERKESYPPKRKRCIPMLLPWRVNHRHVGTKIHSRFRFCFSVWQHQQKRKDNNRESWSELKERKQEAVQRHCRSRRDVLPLMFKWRTWPLWRMDHMTPLWRMESITPHPNPPVENGVGDPHPHPAPQTIILWRLQTGLQSGKDSKCLHKAWRNRPFLG